MLSDCSKIMGSGGLCNRRRKYSCWACGVCTKNGAIFESDGPAFVGTVTTRETSLIFCIKGR
jgi:hypothetical protein